MIQHVVKGFVDLEFRLLCLTWWDKFYTPKVPKRKELSSHPKWLVHIGFLIKHRFWSSLSMWYINQTIVWSSLITLPLTTFSFSVRHVPLPTLPLSPFFSAAMVTEPCLTVRAEGTTDRKQVSGVSRRSLQQTTPSTCCTLSATRCGTPSLFLSRSASYYRQPIHLWCIRAVILSYRGTGPAS